MIKTHVVYRIFGGSFSNQSFVFRLESVDKFNEIVLRAFGSYICQYQNKNRNKIMYIYHFYFHNYFYNSRDVIILLAQPVEAAEYIDSEG